MSPGPLRIDVITSLPVLEKLVPEWDSLVAQDSAEAFFRGSSWYVSWITAIGQQAQPLVLAIRHEGALVALAPLYTAVEGIAQFVGFGGSDLVCGEYFDVVALPEYRRRATEAMLDWFASSEVNWDISRFDSVCSDAPLIEHTRRWSALHKYSFVQGWQSVCPVIDLPTSFDAYLGRLGGKRKKHFSRAIRRFKEHGVEIRTHTTGKELEVAIDTLLRLHRLRWESVGVAGSLALPKYRDFLRTLPRRQTSGCLRLYVMEDAGVPIAAMLNFHHGSHAFHYQNGFDPSSRLARYSPGTVLILHAIQAAIGEGLARYDFLRGREPYKFQFTNAYNTTQTVLVGRTTLGRGYASFWKIRRRLAEVKAGFVNRPRTADLSFPKPATNSSPTS